MPDNTTDKTEWLTVPLTDIATDALPRDRLALEEQAQAVEMMELKDSIRSRGQGAPVDLIRDGAGRLHLLTGWRRYVALSQLHHETGRAEFGVIQGRLRLHDAGLPIYAEIAESNLHRENLTLAEMANVARLAAADPTVESADAQALVNDLYGTLHKTTRSFIRSFITLMDGLDDALRWPRAVPRNLGIEVARMLDNPARLASLKAALGTCGSAAAQNRTLERFAAREAIDTTDKPKPLTLTVGDTRVIARAGEIRLTSKTNFASLPPQQLEAAVRAFDKIIQHSGWVRSL